MCRTSVQPLRPLPNPMNPDLLIGRLEAFAYQLRQLVQGLPSDQARWRPAEGGMSVLEIVGNLCDREVLDFRPRLERPCVTPRSRGLGWRPTTASTS